MPEKARWEYLMSQAKQDDIAIKIDTALHEIEVKNEVAEQLIDLMEELKDEKDPFDELGINYEEKLSMMFLLQ